MASDAPWIERLEDVMYGRDDEDRKRNVLSVVFGVLLWGSFVLALALGQTLGLLFCGFVASAFTMGLSLVWSGYARVVQWRALRYYP